MLDTIDSLMGEIKPLLHVEEACMFESDLKPMGYKDKIEYAIYLIKGDEVFKVTLAELTARQMRDFLADSNFNRYLHQRMDRLAVKAGFKASVMNNDKIEKDFSNV
ncbi:MAG: hypothetical protein ACRC6V_19400 [Bacteroidales bacterium]